MPDFFMPLSEVEWVEQLVCDRYKVKIPKFLADAHEWWGSWEKERFRSMEENLKQGDILFDVGAETGWISAIYAQFVGPQNMVLFEPCPQNWPNIKATWDENNLKMPAATCWTLVGDGVITAISHYEEWPVETTNIPDLIKNVKYHHIDENAHNTPQCTIDWFVWSSCIYPKAITIDVEGAELLVLRGARHTLKTARPLVWLSLHEGLTRPGVEPKNQDCLDFMASMDYEATLLAVDHEAHYLFRPR